ncbi:MAG: acyl-CoA dehydrogenase family protein [Burkholderiaceae bacterium]
MNAVSPPARSFAGVTLEQACENARSLVPVLRERATRQEAARQLLPETIQDLNHLGILRFGQPKRYGGMELDYRAIFDVPYEIGRGCLSTAWNVGNLGIHHWMLALYDERAQEEVWADNPDVLIASGIAYPQGRARRVDGGVEISGHWNFSSGVDPSDWNRLAVPVFDGDTVVDHRMCLVPSDDYEIIDDWQVMGMCGTGSKSVKAEKIFVPEYRALCMYTARGEATFPGAQVNPSPNYLPPLSAYGSHCIGGAIVGNAQAAVEMTIEAIKARSTNYTGMRMRDFQALQLRVSGAAARVEAARVLARSDCATAQRIAEEGRMPTLEEKLQAKRNIAYAVQICTEAVDALHMLAGANGIYERYPMQRLFRDHHAGMAHIGFSWDAQGGPWALVAMGGEVHNPVL